MSLIKWLKPGGRNSGAVGGHVLPHGLGSTDTSFRDEKMNEVL